MAAAEWWCCPLPAWLGSSAAWFLLLNVVVGAIFALSTRAQPQSPSARRGITRRASSALLQRLRSFSIFSFPSSPSGFHTVAPGSPATFRGTEDAGTGAWTRSSSMLRAVAPLAESEPTTATPAAAEVDEEDVNSMSMDEVVRLWMDSLD